MLHFSKIKTMLIWAVCAIGVLLSLTNFVKPGTLPDWLPSPRFNLGLDLQGGAYSRRHCRRSAAARWWQEDGDRSPPA